MNQLRAALAPFISLTDSEWAALAPQLHRRQLRAEEWLLAPGQVCQEISFVSQGLLRTCYQRPDQAEVNFLFHFPRTFVTDYESVLLREPARLGIQALAPTQVLALPVALLPTLYEDVRWQRFGRLMAEQIYLAARRRAEELLFLTPTQRYEKLLHEQPDWLRELPLRHLASYLGVQPESLSRIRQRLTQPAPVGGANRGHAFPEANTCGGPAFLNQRQG
ncbi:Crp/Fnr family transcriptional regulator [Hymenobacter psychrophilus]|uniref:cAMP-binding domain of CRP or a regulatory subunit of cAMP-dependent protein kinases n=1 Tax=Hymenobacter psychrophilus TaxID=651662 RepID=A0A1H3B0J8_9BACT|nr:Crp/Fnr family transcriptional regulator [Hymenobacter psychrophilus]SDX35486.1 cAMP-binding domain of CRP or a regulatory subunit of cAMP-dependent protein kinases [Hymenobacter psychrophilus]